MNANEIIEELQEALEPPSLIDDAWLRDIIVNAWTMLRQQQAEIEALKVDNLKYKEWAEYLGLELADAIQSILRKAQEK